MAPWEDDARSRIDVEQIVREVLARLAAAEDQSPGGGQSSRAVGAPASQVNRPQAMVKTSELALAGKVVSLSQLEGRLDGIARLRVPKATVVTPSARDLLRRSGVALEYSNPQNQPATGHRLVLGVAATSYEPAGLIRAIAQDGTEIEQLSRTGLLSVLDEACEQVSKGGWLGLVLTTEAAATVCLANRRRGVRAVAAAEPQAVAAAVNAVGANLLAVDPAGRSYYQLRQIVRQFTRGGPRCCPTNYESWLNHADR